MKGFFLRIPETLDRRFTSYCEREGYKKSGLILKWIHDHLELHEPKDPLAEAKAFGVDIQRLKINLRKTPTQRLQEHASAAAFSIHLRKAKLGK
jgi:hypothetical protein